MIVWLSETAGEDPERIRAAITAMKRHGNGRNRPKPRSFDLICHGSKSRRHCGLIKAHPTHQGAGKIYLVQLARRLPSGIGTKFLKRRAFQPVKVAYAGGRLLKDMLRHFQRRDGLADQEPTIRDDLVQRLPQNRDRRCIKFLFQIIHRSQPK
jgi:hypothetical protein